MPPQVKYERAAPLPIDLDSAVERVQELLLMLRERTNKVERAWGVELNQTVLDGLDLLAELLATASPPPLQEDDDLERAERTQEALRVFGGACPELLGVVTQLVEWVTEDPELLADLNAIRAEREQPEDDYDELTVAELRQEMDVRELEPAGGNRHVIIRALREDDARALGRHS